MNPKYYFENYKAEYFGYKTLQNIIQDLLVKFFKRSHENVN